MSTIITKTMHQITPDVLTEIEGLVQSCRDEDNNVLPIYPHLLEQYRSTPCNVLCYQQNQLIGFLSLFFFYQDGVEVAVMVKPSCRRSGIAKHMLAEVLPILHGFQIKTLFFSSPSAQNKQWFREHAFRYQSSEYQMQRTIDAPVVIEHPELSIRLVTEPDIPILCAMDDACFTTSTPNAFDRFQRLMHDTKYSLYIAALNGVPVGKVHLCWQDDWARLTDLAVIPSMQGQGLGRTLILHCVNEVFANKKRYIRLDVEAVNDKALRLYTNLGFETTNAYDYWTTSLMNPVLLSR